MQQKRILLKVTVLTNQNFCQYENKSRTVVIRHVYVPAFKTKSGHRLSDSTKTNEQAIFSLQFWNWWYHSMIPSILQNFANLKSKSTYLSTLKLLKMLLSSYPTLAREYNKFYERSNRNPFFKSWRKCAFYEKPTFLSSEESFNLKVPYKFLSQLLNFVSLCLFIVWPLLVMYGRLI